MATIAKAGIDIVAQDKTMRAFQSAQSNMDKFKNRLGAFRAAVGAAFAVAGVAAVARFGQSVIDAGDKLQKLSIRLGASTEALSEYRHVAELSGVSFDTLTMAWQRMTRRVAEAAQGTGEAKDALKELGVNAEQLNKLKPEQQFEVLADALMEVSNEADRVRLAMKLFDSEGVRVLQTMEGGAAAIRKMRDEANEMGMTLSRAEADQMARFNDAMTRLGNIAGGSAQRLVADLAPALAEIAEWLGNQLPKAFDIVGEAINWFLRTWAQLIQGVVDGLTQLSALGERIPWLGDKFKGTTEALESFSGKIDGFIMKTREGAGTTATFGAEVDRLERNLVKVDQTLVRQEKRTKAQLEAEKEAEKAAKQSAKESEKAAKKAAKEMEKAWSDSEGAVERFVRNAEFSMDGLKDVAKAVAGDIINQFMKTGNLQLPGFGGGASGGGSFLSGIGSAIGGFFGFANGGVMTSGGPLPLRKYAKGGIATSPQLAMFGEGAHNEAYVPLPDGRSIPVTMKGGGGGMVYNIDARGSGPGVEEKIRQVLRQERPGIVQESVGKSIAHVESQANRGGSFAKAMGRR